MQQLKNISLRNDIIVVYEAAKPAKKNEMNIRIQCHSLKIRCDLLQSIHTNTETVKNVIQTIRNGSAESIGFHLRACQTVKNTLFYYFSVNKVLHSWFPSLFKTNIRFNSWDWLSQIIHVVEHPSFLLQIETKQKRIHFEGIFYARLWMNKAWRGRK